MIFGGLITLTVTGTALSTSKPTAETPAGFVSLTVSICLHCSCFFILTKTWKSYGFSSITVQWSVKRYILETGCADMPHKEGDCKSWYDESSTWCNYNMTGDMHRTCSKSCGFCGEEEAGITISFYLLLLIGQSSAQQWICYVK